MKAAEDYVSETSQRDLASGILEQAGQDLRRFHSGTTAVEREIYRDAYRWVISDDCSWPFSFLNVCQLLNFAPDILRAELLSNASVGFFTHWSRRCARAARSLQIFLNRGLPQKRRSTGVDPVPMTVHAIH